MIALVYDNDPQARQVLSHLLRDQGFTTVLSSNSPAQFRHYLRTVTDKIGLIVFGSEKPEQFQLQLFQQIQNMRELDSAPMILISDSFQARTSATKKLGTDFMRVDSILGRPFGAKHLRQAIKDANEQRNMNRDVLVYFSKEENPTLSEVIYESPEAMHWRAIEHAKDLDGLKAILSRTGYRVGTIMIDPYAVDARARKWIANYKKTPIGVRTPVVCLSQEATELDGLRLECDLYVDEFSLNEAAFDRLQDILKTTSKRLIDRWAVRESTVKARDLIKSQQYKDAFKELKNVNRLSDKNWELAELMGIAAEKIGKSKDALKFYESARKSNPCSPVSHLGILRIYEQEKSKLSMATALALKYCPRHPQILTEAMKLNGTQVMSQAKTVLESPQAGVSLNL